MLRDVERVVDEVDRCAAVETAAHVVRGHDVELPGAIRWTRRRVNAVRAALVAVIDVMPGRFGHCQPTLASFRQALGVELVLPTLRDVAADHLATLPTPLGFATASCRVSRRRRRSTPHVKGADPPPEIR